MIFGDPVVSYVDVWLWCLDSCSNVLCCKVSWCVYMDISVINFKSINILCYTILYLLCDYYYFLYVD
jgi:hypothetical protein